MVRESRSSWVLRNMRESREISSNERNISFVNELNGKIYKELLYSFGEDEIIKLSKENKILCNNVKELQQQLQNAYIRIKNLTSNSDQMELF
tara:strand:- start:551 stop:826 length:276 start_codon:yes stop_codon:yes gene_type:complete